MSWDDYVFEDPWESYDRSQSEPTIKALRFPRKPEISRQCVRCEHKFRSVYPKACPDCGGWTEIKKGAKK